MQRASEDHVEPSVNGWRQPSATNQPTDGVVVLDPRSHWVITAPRPRATSPARCPNDPELVVGRVGGADSKLTCIQQCWAIAYRFPGQRTCLRADRRVRRCPTLSDPIKRENKLTRHAVSRSAFIDCAPRITVQCRHDNIYCRFSFTAVAVLPEIFVSWLLYVYLYSPTATTVRCRQPGYTSLYSFKDLVVQRVTSVW